MAFTIGGKGGKGSAGGKVSGDYKFKQNNSNELVLTYKNDPVSVMSPNGSWFDTSISTGVGSLHLGGNESGGVAHSISSTGQNVGFKNEYSKLAEKDKLFFFPVWQGCSIDGVSLSNPAMLSFGALNTNTLPNGIIHLNATTTYDFNLIPTANSVTYSVEVIAAENYIGTIRNVIISNVTNAEIYNTSQEVAVTSGQPLSIKYKYPLFVRTGDDLQLRLIKEDGTYLRCRSGDANVALPYRKLSARSFTDVEVAASNGWNNSRILTTDTNGKMTVNAAINGGRVLVSNASGLPIASGASSTEIDCINGNVDPDASMTIADADGFVISDDRVMKKTTASRLWAYIQSKLNVGALGPFLTSNMENSRMVFSNSSGKLSEMPARLDPAEVPNFVGQSYVGRVTRTGSSQWLNVFDEIRGLTPRFELTTAHTGFSIINNSGGNIRYMCQYGHTSLSATYSTSSVTSGSVFLTMAASSGRIWMVHGTICDPTDLSKYFHFRIHTVDETSTAHIIYAQVW